MSIYGNTAIAIVPETEITAPFMGYCGETAERLLRMGVMNEEGELQDTSISILAAAFASNFYDSMNEYCEDNYDMFDHVYGSINELFQKEEITGMYFYVVLCCGLMETTVPGELTWIARREDVLSLYMLKFMETTQKLIENENDTLED